MFAEMIFGIRYVVLALLGLLLGVVFRFVDTFGAAHGAKWIIMQRAYSPCWRALGLAAAVKSLVTPLPQNWAIPLAGLGFGFYFVFLVPMLTSRSA
jgi:hypothetical protein